MSKHPIVTLAGRGTQESPYLIANAADLGTIYRVPDACYRLTASIDLSGVRWSMPVIPFFSGWLDGNGFEICNLTVSGAGDLGLFGRIERGGEVRHLGITDANVMGIGDRVGGFVGINAGIVNTCFCDGKVSGRDAVGGFAGINSGSMIQCYSLGVTSGKNRVGKLVGENAGPVHACFSSGTVAGLGFVGGITGENISSISNCYTDCQVSGTDWVAGLVGTNRPQSKIYHCYSAAQVSTGKHFGFALVGPNNSGTLAQCFWDKDQSPHAFGSKDEGSGLTTVQMQDVNTYVKAGWDFKGETDNGTKDIWSMPEQGYPRLSWESE